MELVVKLYDGKPSRIGIRYVYEYMALKDYEQLISEHGSSEFSLSIELVRGKAFVVLCSDNTGEKIVYKDLEFKTEQMRKLQVFQDAGLPMQFVHIFPKGNTLFVAKPFRREQFVSISSVEFITPAGTTC
jgi:hypothetical protein